MQEVLKFFQWDRQNPAGRSAITFSDLSSARPARATVPSSNNRPSSVTPCGTRRGGENFGSGCAGVRCPIAARFAHFHKARPHGQRRMPCEIRDHQCLIAQRRNQQQIHLGEVRAISSATLRRKRSARTKSTAERKRDCRNRFGQASGTCAFIRGMPPLSVSFRTPPRLRRE